MSLQPSSNSGDMVHTSKLWPKLGGLCATVTLKTRSILTLNPNMIPMQISRPPDKSVYWKNYFLYFSSKTYVVGTQQNCQ